MAICKCYDMDNQQCLGTRERENCKCEGNEANCDFYPYKREKKENEPKRVEESKPDSVEALKAKFQWLEEENRRLALDREYLQGFFDAVDLLTRGKKC